MVYVQFYTTGCMTGKEIECSGSDGVFILDGRNRLDIMIQDAKDRIRQLRFVKSDIVAFSICKGDRFSDSREVYRERT